MNDAERGGSMNGHFVSASCGGERCGPCFRDGRSTAATHKVGEEIMWDDPMPNRHNLTQYVCCEHFGAVLGPFAARLCAAAPPPEGEEVRGEK